MAVIRDLNSNEPGYLPEPRTTLARLLRDLADAAMQVTHHDISQTDPSYRREVVAMEDKFRKLLASYHRKKARDRAALAQKGE